MARPIDTAPKNGKIILVGDDDGTVRAAFWHGPLYGQGMWCFVLPCGTATNLPFTPTRWGESIDEFERD